MFYKAFFQAGLWYIQDLYGSGGTVVPFHVWVSRGVRKNNFIKWMGLIDKTRRLNKDVLEPVNGEPNQLSLFSEGPVCAMANIIICDKLLQRQTGDHAQVPKVSKYIEDVTDIEWSNIYVRGNKTPPDTKTKDFQYRFMQDLLSNRYWLHKWQVTDSATCLYCNIKTETISHLFWECSDSRIFWR